MPFRIRHLALLLPLAFVAIARAQDALPDPITVRKQIDALIANPPDHRATLGTLSGAFQLSISYGAPAWNAGDHDACCNFYVKTAQSLTAAFAGPNAATPGAAPLLNDLKAALERIKASTDSDANAWIMRFVFDKTEIMAAGEADRSAKLLELGEASMLRSQFVDAANAFDSAAAALHELDGQPMEQIPVPCRYAPFALCDALFAQKRYAAAAGALQQGLHLLPDLPPNMDLRKHFADPGIYQLLAADLSDAAAAKPNDPALQLLLGYHLLYTGQRAAAKPYLEKALTLDPKNPAPAQLLKQYDADYHPVTTPPALPSHLSA